LFSQTDEIQENYKSSAKMGREKMGREKKERKGR
jgi:hypothetical protein